MQQHPPIQTSTLINYLLTEMKKLFSLFIAFMALMKQGTASTQLTLIMSVTSVMSVVALIVQLFNEYVFPDANFAKVFLIIIMLDTIFGGIRHFKESIFDFKELVYGLAKKMFLGLAVMMFTKAVLSMPEMVSSTYLTQTVTLFLKSSIIGWIGFSFLGSVYILSGQKFPPSIFMQRFKKFSETGNAKDLLQADELEEFKKYLEEKEKLEKAKEE